MGMTTADPSVVAPVRPDARPRAREPGHHSAWRVTSVVLAALFAAPLAYLIVRNLGLGR